MDGWKTEDFHDTGQLFDLVLAREERETGIELGKDAAEAEHVYGHGVVEAEYHLGRAVETALDVCVHCIGKQN